MLLYIYIKQCTLGQVCVYCLLVVYRNTLLFLILKAGNLRNNFPTPTMYDTFSLYLFLFLLIVIEA